MEGLKSEQSWLKCKISKKVTCEIERNSSLKNVKCNKKSL